jgi:GLPGLI family protein
LRQFGIKTDLMKTNISLLILFWLAIPAIAQETKPLTGNGGTVVYEQVVKLEIKVEGESAQFAKMMPKERKSQKVLYFNPSASLYENKATEEDQTMKSESGNTVMIKMVEPNNKVYTNLTENSQVEKREFMTREFLVESALNPAEWKLTGNQRVILNYPCQEAVKETKEGKASAWFTPVIPVSAGPGTYNGLPGLVLAVDVNDGKQTITAVSVDLNPVADNVIVKPDKGKKVTREEFDKIVEDKMKEMGGQSGPGGARMIIRIHP